MANIIAASRVAGTPVADLVAGCRVIPCDNCGRDLWASPSSQRAIAAGDKIYCVDMCAHIKLLEEEAATGEKAEFQGIPGWEQEIADHLGPDAEDVVIEMKSWLIDLNESHRES